MQNFPLSYGRPGYVLAAGGIGITALVATGQALKARREDYRFVYGAQSRNLMAFPDPGCWLRRVPSRPWDDSVCEHGFVGPLPSDLVVSEEGLRRDDEVGV